jgi:hypothetical protein
VGLWQGVSAPTQNLIHHLSLANATNTGWKQEIHAQDLCGKAGYILPGFSNLVLELVDECSVALVGSCDEGFVDAVQDIWTPNRGIAEQQRAVAQQAVRSKIISCFVDLAGVVF